MEGVMEVILFTVHILDPDVVLFRHAPIVGFGIF